MESQLRRCQRPGLLLAGFEVISIGRFCLIAEEFTLAPIYLPSYTPVEGPPARRFANNYTRLFIRYPGLEDSKLGAEGMTGGEKFKMGYKLATDG